jgi:predicted N-formylglutamate amidohydrolase
MRNRPQVLVVSCEHAGNRVPVRYRHLFSEQEGVLETHRAYDIGIYPIARQVTRRLDCPFFAFPVTRLLIDANRAIGHRNLLSEFSRRLATREREHLIDAYYRPYRERVTNTIEQLIARERSVLHASLHSFTAEYQGRLRNADIGLLYDTERARDVGLATLLRAHLAADKVLRVRCNYPYRGASDGLVSYLRRRFAGRSYVGLEIEANQGLFDDRPLAKTRPSPGQLAGILADGLGQLLSVGEQVP